MLRSTLRKMNVALIARLRAEQATNCALRGMLESRGKVVSDFVIAADEQSFDFILQAVRADSTGKGQGAISAPKRT